MFITYDYILFSPVSLDGSSDIYVHSRSLNLIFSLLKGYPRAHYRPSNKNKRVQFIYAL